MTANGARAGSALRVLVVALTYKRPDDIREMIPALISQAESVAHSVRILIVDNDPDSGARAHVESIGGNVSYAHAVIPGIAAARNVAMDWATEDDVLVFIDDDERPVEQWLRNLLDVWERLRPVAVVGPVISQFVSPLEPWIAAGRFFDRRRLRTGTRVDLVATNNLLLDIAWVRASGIRFDERFGLSGGSDTLFARRLHLAGAAMVWCDEAIVYDIVPSHRSTRRWVMQRAFRSGNTWMRTSLELASSPGQHARTRILLAARGTARIIAGTARVVLGIIMSRLDHRARGSRTIARGAGLVAGAVGSIYSEYKR